MTANTDVSTTQSSSVNPTIIGGSTPVGPVVTSEGKPAYQTPMWRFFEIVLGVLTWAVVLSPVWLGLLYPQAMVYVLTLLTLYWSYLAVMSTVGLSIGYPKYMKEISINWYEECKKLNFSVLPEKSTLPIALEDVNHFILIPCVSEPYPVLEDTFNSFMAQSYPTQSFTLVFTLEEKYADRVRADIEKITGPFKDQFADIMIYVHPAGIPGEAIGIGGANRTWGARHAVAELTSQGKNLRNFIFSSFDADHILHKEYMARLTHLYLTTGGRDNHFYSTSVHLFNNNHWRVSSMMRIESNFVTLGTLASRSAPWGISSLTKDTFAAYSSSLQTLIDADYWDVQLGQDDTLFFWRAFFKRDGDFKLASHYVPYSADAVEGPNFWSAHKSLYKQLVRWGWGALEFPMSMTGFLKNNRIPLWKKILWTYDHIKTRVVLINIVYLITFGFAILTFVNPDVKQSSFAYSLPDTMSSILTMTLVFLLPPIYFRKKLSPDIPKDWSLLKRFIVSLEGFLVIGNLLTFSFFPFIEAQTRMMLGKRMKDLYHTPKVR